ncbi:hypothetical protein [Streptomyces sp. NPDC057689]|uniref:hypothetical protein n=1 Tax=Streptomyces sp. NPDC057689 TaxID=3346213 RepID=UPI0036C52298
MPPPRTRWRPLPIAVIHPGRDAAPPLAQQVAAVQAHQQAAMPEDYLEGRPTDPATWLRTRRTWTGSPPTPAPPRPAAAP